MILFMDVINVTTNDKNWLAWASDKLLFIFLILILVLDSSSWCTYGGFRTWGGEQGGLRSPRSRPKVLSPDNLAIFVAQLVGKHHPFLPINLPIPLLTVQEKQGQEQISLKHSKK